MRGKDPPLPGGCSETRGDGSRRPGHDDQAAPLRPTRPGPAEVRAGHPGAESPTGGNTRPQTQFALRDAQHGGRQSLRRRGGGNQDFVRRTARPVQHLLLCADQSGRAQQRCDPLRAGAIGAATLPFPVDRTELPPELPGTGANLRPGAPGLRYRPGPLPSSHRPCPVPAVDFQGPRPSRHADRLRLFSGLHEFQPARFQPAVLPHRGSGNRRL